MSTVFIKSAAIPRTVRHRQMQSVRRSPGRQISVFRNALACLLIGVDRDRVTGFSLFPPRPLAFRRPRR